MVYGLLNPKDTAQYIRVSKVFLGEGNALVMAQTQDSIQFRPSDIEVRITRKLNGSEMSYWILQADSSIPRDPGIFNNPFQILYRGSFPVLTDGSTYLLTVTDLHTGYQVTSETHIVKDVHQSSPTATQAVDLSSSSQVGFYFTTPPYAKSYHLMLRFYYDEQFIFDTTEVSTHYVDWSIGDVLSSTAQGGEHLLISVRRDNFIRMLANNIEYNPMVRRISKTFSCIYTVGSEDLDTYIRVQQANNSSSTDLPGFSNITNGIGLFSSRNLSTLPNYHIDQNTGYALVNDPLLSGLNFVR